MPLIICFARTPPCTPYTNIVVINELHLLSSFMGSSAFNGQNNPRNCAKMICMMMLNNEIYAIIAWRPSLSLPPTKNIFSSMF